MTHKSQYFYGNKISDYGIEDDREIFQYFIVSDNAVSILTDANEIVFYNEELDMNVWGVTHYGTGWDYVLTDIKLELK